MAKVSLSDARRPRGQVPLLLSLARLAVWWRARHGLQLDQAARRFALVVHAQCGRHFRAERLSSPPVFDALLTLGETRPDSQAECIALLDLIVLLQENKTK